jgi:phage terminase small subunit
MHDRLKRFVEEYLVDLNAAAAARRCGYPPKTAAARGCKLLYRKDVRAAVREAMAARAERTQITADRVLRELARIGFSDLRRVSEWGPKGVTLKSSAEVSDDAAAAVAWVSVGGRKGTHAQRIRLHDKHRALTLLARHLGLFDLRRFGGDPESAGMRRREEGQRAREKFAARIAALAKPE